MARRKLRALPSDLVDLTRLPTEKLASKARRILTSISGGECYTTYRGKRLKYDRKVISVPINHDYRIIYDHTPNGMVPRRVMSHEQYNATKPAA